MPKTLKEENPGLWVAMNEIRLQLIARYGEDEGTLIFTGNREAIHAGLQAHQNNHN